MNGWCEFSHAALRPRWPMAPAQAQAIAAAPRRTAYQLLRGGPGAWAAGSSRRLDGYRVVGRRRTYVSRMRAVCMPRLLAHSPEDGMAGEGSVSLRYLA